jgi:hypothetical protein
MEFTISTVVVFKAMLFLVVSVYWALICLFPRNDQPTTKGQKVFYIITEALIYSFIFGIVTIRLV